MFPNPWLLIPLMLAFIVALSFKEERNKKWIFPMWFPVMVIASAGTLYFLYAIFSAGNLSSGPDTGLAGVAIIVIIVFSSPFLVLLYLCLRYRPGPQAYTLPYVLPTVLVILIAVVLLIVLGVFGVRLHIWT